MKPRVYALNYLGHDISDAERFTDEPVIFLTEGSVNIFYPDRLAYDIAKKLHDFQQDDYILISGSPVIAMIAMGVLKETFKFKTINVLIYNVKKGEYVARRISGAVARGY